MVGVGWALGAAAAFAGDPSDEVAARVDWAAAGEEAAALLSAYLRVDTSNPPGREADGVALLGDVLQREGIPFTTYEFAPGRSSLVARVEGRSALPGLCLVSHVDVASAERSGWTSGHGPFSGDRADGAVWGRGALDMKGFGVVQLLTLVWAKRLNVPLERDLVLVAVGDEEVDNQGVRQLAARWDEVGCSHVLNEGGIGLRDLFFPDQTVYGISVAEKGVLWLKMTANGEPGHGSTPRDGTAPVRLHEAVTAVQQRKVRPDLHPAFDLLFARVGRERGGLPGVVLRSRVLVRWFVLPRFMADPATRAAITNTCNLTGFGGAAQPNVVPSEVWAQLDCRALPGTSTEALFASIRALVRDPNVTFEVLHRFEANESPSDDPLFRALERRLVDGRENVAVGPVVSVGSTDSSFLRPLGVRAYGVEPFEVTLDDLATMHGNDERISEVNLRDGLRRMFLTVLDVALPGPATPP